MKLRVLGLMLINAAFFVFCIWFIFIVVWELLPGQYKLMLAASPWGYAYFYIAHAVSLATAAYVMYKTWQQERYR